MKKSAFAFFVFGLQLLLAPQLAWSQGCQNLEAAVEYVRRAITPAHPARWRLWDKSGPGGQRKRLPDVLITNVAAYNPAIETKAQASRRKAEAIVNAVNATLGAGRAEVVRDETYTIRGQTRYVTRYRVYDICWSQIIWDPGREAGAAEFTPGGAPFRGAMGRVGLSAEATGIDPLGEPSVAEFGIIVGDSTELVAIVDPSPGMTHEAILLELESLLETKGISASYDFSRQVLSLDAPLSGGQILWWGDTDTGVSFSVDAGTEFDEISTAITLSSFTANVKARKIVLRWETETEIDNIGFNILRAEAEDGEYVKINKKLIPAKGSATKGTEYKFKDKNVEPGKTYYYQLEDIDRNNENTLHGPKPANVSFKKKWKR